MCIHRRTIQNPYTGHRIVINCGHCPACLQEKANKRVNRILNTTQKGEIYCFGTLTYDNMFVPYFEKSNVDGNSFHIMRKCSLENQSFSDVYNICQTPEVLGTVFHRYKIDDIKKCKSLKNLSGCVGVLWYPDAQNFIKRFRQNIQNYYGKEKKIKYFICGEYGGKGCRPHFHVVLWCNPDEYDLYRSAFLKSWRFHDLSKVDARRVFEQGQHCASYVASYINSSSYVPKILRLSPFRQKSSASRGFGVGNPDFTLFKVEELIRSDYLDYAFSSSKNGVPVVSSLQIPSYVINRYYPRFKGYSRLADSEIFDVVANPSTLAKYARKLEYRYDCFNNDIHRERVKLDNAFYKWCLEHDYQPTLLARQSFAFDYLDAWRAARRTTWRNFYRGVSESPLTSYDNLFDVLNGKCENETLLNVLELQESNDSIELDYNKFAPLVASTKSLESLYYKKDKSKKVTNYVLSKIYENF